MKNDDYAVLHIECTEPYADGVHVNPAGGERRPTYLVDPAVSSEEPTEPFLSRMSVHRASTSTNLDPLSRYSTTEEEPHVRWRLPSSLLVTA